MTRQRSRGTASAVRQHPTCPSCRRQPHTSAEADQLREDLQTVWWSTALDNPAQIVATRHCSRCQPHEVYVVACLMCGDGPILAGQLAKLTLDSDPQRLPPVVVDQMTATGWRWGSGHRISGWVCCR